MSALALVHQRYSTNTFPTWDLAHPFRYLAHNGEINTLRGNVNWMHARESMLASEKYGPDLKKICPICTPGASDSAMFDNALELLVLTGRSLAAGDVDARFPSRGQDHESMSDDKKAYYEYQACLMEPWDGPASMAFTDGTVIGAVLDRNGLRPSRYWVTKDGLVIMASEAGVLEDSAGRGRIEGPLASRPHVPGRHGPRADHRRRRDQERRWPRSIRIASGCDENQSAARSTTCPPTAHGRQRPPGRAAAQAAARPSATRSKICES